MALVPVLLSCFLSRSLKKIQPSPEATKLLVSNPRLRPRAPHYSTDQEMCQHIFDRGGPLACRTHKPFPLCRPWYLQATPADAAVFAMFRSGHLPEPDLDSLHGPPDSPAPATPHTDFHLSLVPL
jgi:hypothetical protein